ncbi:MAG: protein-L-isoaspartate(D-aspartate) O-methyltransferase [Oceanospirillaceae bacterium]|nr:protein-L-isoaspartate(D-aspartate) O-methyltransferase [Oceanospirillaceae bacterium]
MTSQRTRDRMVQRLREQRITNKDVLEVCARTPRHIFVDEALAHRAYEDTALPIGFGQTISQPYIVARMTSLLILQGPLGRVLEIGTGCGYQTAVLAQLVGHVYSVERIEPLQAKARERMQLLGIENVSFSHADGNWGWPEEAPFDAILSCAAPEQIPEELLNQLAIGGRLIIPVGNDDNQQLVLVVREADGFRKNIIEPVKFVPMLPGTRSIA